MIDGTGKPAVQDAVVCISPDGRIDFAGPMAHAPTPPEDALVVDGRDRTVLPGFIDCHVHLGFDSARDMTRRFLYDPTLEVFKTVDRMHRTLAAGITTARDLGGLSAGFRVAVEREMVVGPAIHTAVRVLSHTGGHGDISAPCGFDPTAGMTYLCDTADEARIAVRKVIREGADVIKVHATGGMGSPYDQPDDQGLSIEEIRAVVDEAARHGGRPVAAHAQGTAGILNAIRGGVTSIEHGYGMTDEACDLAGEQGTYLVPTLSTLFDGIDKATMEPHHYEKKMRWMDTTVTNFGRAIERGVKIAMGTDAAVGPHGQNLRELMHMVSLGMRPMDAITAATRTASELLGVSDRVGTLEVGKVADIVVCNGDPLTDIALLGDPANLAGIFRGGLLVKNSNLLAEAPLCSASHG
ncbi:putative hydrolase [Rhodococcus wratislaviensis NBRC 100605]|uniref:Putative hydrolase n=2 Tax=Rhodococcus wratislaviensis TaxID=44752 RepID=X0QBJ6_RHOWR|nr:putative hydrolase [Rhodococcus wratislaviensis NBRC 100605]